MEGRNRSNNSNNQEQKREKSEKLAPLEPKAKRLDIGGVSMAEFGENSRTVSSVLGVDNTAGRAVDQDSVFRIMSLSKPVFAYLVLKLIKENEVKKDQPWVGQFTLPHGVEKFDLKTTPLWTIYPEMLTKFSPDSETQAYAKELTAHHLLSHQSGLPGRMDEGALLKFKFKPGSEFSYSNPGISLLQDAVEHVTKSDLEALFQAQKPEGMVNSHFLPPRFLNEKDEGKRKAEMKAENSLHTTPSEYAVLINAWMSDAALRNMAIEGQVSMQKDKWAVGQGLTDDDLKKVAWGYGVALQKNDNGKVTSVFHWGDGSDKDATGNEHEWRSLFGYDLDQKKGVVYFANSPNGLMLADEITSLAGVDMQAGLKYIFDKLGFARVEEPGFKEKQGERIAKIIVRFEMDKNEMVEKGLLKIDNNKNQHTFSVTCDPDCSLYTSVIHNAFLKFKETDGMKHANYDVRDKKDQNGNTLFLEIKIPDKALYAQFIDFLNRDNLLPASSPTSVQNRVQSIEDSAKTLEQATTTKQSKSIQGGQDATNKGSVGSLARSIDEKEKAAKERERRNKQQSTYGRLQSELNKKSSRSPTVSNTQHNQEVPKEVARAPEKPNSASPIESSQHDSTVGDESEKAAHQSPRPSGFSTKLIPK